ncbi:MAG: CoA-binding protein [Deltaproteobacteria bacterium]|nr:CoA-binding protein [Deltaproteobacteria bacterium]
MDLDRLFYPKNIAIVGASPRIRGGKLPYFKMLEIIGYKGDLYPVNPKYEEIDGVRAYPSINDLPEGIDLVIVSAPAQQSLEIIKAAVRRKVKFVHFFTAGFSEIGNYCLEHKLIQEASKGITRVVGPNCIGVYCPGSRVGFDLMIQQDSPGDVAFFGQSGGVTSNFVRIANSRQIGLNKVVSYGNQIDIRAEDYLEYFANDEKIRLIAGYIEDIKDPKAFINALKVATQTKPVIILKGGVTEEGARAAASHTGALSSNYQIWASAVRQHRGILVENFEQMLNLIMIAVGRKIPQGPRVGFLGAGGGTSVSFTDLAILEGLSLPELGTKTRELISQRIGEINTSTTNPVDLGAYGFDFTVMSHTMKALDQDRGIDVIIPYFSVDFISTFQGGRAEKELHIITDAVRNIKKPIVPVLSRYTEDDVEMEKVRLSIFSSFRKAGLPVYSTIQDAVYSIRKYLEWSSKHVRIVNSE